MEYLTTYGWAILILAIVALVIVSSGLLTQRPTDICSFEYNLTCSSYYINSNGILNITIAQKTGYNITATYIGCDSNVSSSPILLPISDNVPNGGSFSSTVQCYYGGKYFNSSISGTYQGYVVLEYTSELSGYQHTNVGRIVYNIG